MNKKYSSFTRTMLSIAVPVTLQNLLFSSLTFIDTLMIGRLGDLPLAAVGMAGKWTWFLGIVLFGFSSGAAVFIAQYFGAGDEAGIHRTHGLMGLCALGVSLLFTALALIMPEKIIGLFTRDPDAIRTACVYLRIVALAYPFQALRRTAGTVLESTQQVVIPFASAVCSVTTNIVFNALLIYGLCGFPRLGVAGAAIATVMASVVDAAVIHAAGLKKKTLLRTRLSQLFDIRGDFVLRYLRIGAPALFNETTWALSNLIYSAIYGHMSTQAYAAITICKSIEDLSCVAIFGLASSCAVMLGSYVGQGDMEKTRGCARYHLKLTMILSLAVGLLVVLLRGGILSVFGVSDAVRADAAAVLVVYGLELVLRNIPYMLVVGIFRAGGDTRYALLVDFVSAYLIGIPLTAAAGLVLHLSVPLTYLIMYLSEDVLKVFLYGKHFLSEKWIRPVI